MNYWLHRITGGDGALEFAHPLLFNNRYLSIGWSDFSEDVFVKNIREHGAEYLDEAMQNAGYGLPRNRWNLFRFINEMQKDDIVLVPTWNEFSLFKIADDMVLTNQSIDASLLKNWNGNLAQLQEDGYFHNTDGGYVDLGFYRKVTPVLLNIPREEYAEQDLYSRMKIRQTNANISDLRESVEKARKAFAEGKPINLKELIVEEAAPKLLSLIEKLTNDIKRRHKASKPKLNGLRPCKINKSANCSNNLTCDSCKCCTSHAPAKREDSNRIKDNVDDTSKKCCDHRKFRTSVSPDD